MQKRHGDATTSAAALTYSLPFNATLIAVSLERLSGQHAVVERTYEEGLGERPPNYISLGQGVAARTRTVRTGEYRLTAHGAQLVEELSDEEYRRASDFQLTATDDSEARTADAEWEPLPVERPDRELDHLIEAAEQASEQVRSDNGFAANHPVEREEILHRIGAGLNYLRTAEVFTYTSIQIYVVWPALRLLSRFPTSTIIGAAATKVLSLLEAYFKKKGIDAIERIVAGSS